MRFIALLLIFIFLAVGCTATEKPIIQEPPPEDKPAVVEETKAPGLKPAHDFTLKDLNQGTFTLSSYKNKQPVLLFFWTTWCPYCLGELRVLNGAYQQLVKEGWEVFAINVAESAHRVENFARRNALTFKILLDTDAAVIGSYDLFGVPTCVIIDRQGYIVFNDNYFPRARFRELIQK